MRDESPPTRDPEELTPQARARGRSILTFTGIVPSNGCRTFLNGARRMRWIQLVAVTLAYAVAPVAARAQATNGMGMQPDTMSAQSMAAAQVAHESMEGAMPMASAHMRMTPPRVATAADSARAAREVKVLHAAIAKYGDYRVAEADGYRPFLPNVPQKVYHFTSRRRALLATVHFDPARPTSLLYRKTGSGYELVSYHPRSLEVTKHRNACGNLATKPMACDEVLRSSLARSAIRIPCSGLPAAEYPAVPWRFPHRCSAPNAASE